MRTIRFGIIGGGVMGREFASAVARWGHLTDMPARPRIVAVAGRSGRHLPWFEQSLGTVKRLSTDWRELLDDPEIDAIYAAVPHDLHQEVFTATLQAGKHLMGEKPFGIDRAANDAINAQIARHPDLLVRVASQMHFFPAAQRIGKMIAAGEIGRVIELRTGFLHSSDLNPLKPINWKRQAVTNGAYGAMGDLGMHACSIPLRAGWRPVNVRAILRKLISHRPDANGQLQPCDTPDNATLLCEMRDPATDERFPWTLRTHRIAPGEQNSWYVQILGTKTSVRFSTVNAKRLEMLRYSGGAEQAWCAVETGSETTYPVISAPAFEFGFSDAILQMWGAFVTEWATQRVPGPFARCVTPEEVALSHRLFTAALESHQCGRTVDI